MGRTRTQIVPLYQRLPHGPNGLGRDEVARNQRARIYGAMIESVAERGYHATAVADVIALAGVSRRAFYEQFANKQECFVATHDIAVARARKSALEGWRRERGWANRVHSAWSATLCHAAYTPKGLRLVFVDSLGTGGRGVYGRLTAAHGAFERIVASGLDLADDGRISPPLTARAVVGGARHLAFTRMLDGRERELAAMTDVVLDWIDAYRLPRGGRLPPLTAAPATSPVPAARAHFLAAGEERARALVALVHLTLAEGYPPLSDAQIAELAGLRLDVFHRHFACKEAAFLAVLEDFAGESGRVVQAAVDGSGSWPQAVRRAMSTLVAHFAAHEALLRIAFVALCEIGPAITRRLTRPIEAVVNVLVADAPRARHGGQIAREAITGALWAIVAAAAARGRLARVPALADHLSFVALAPYLGPRGALAEIAGAHDRG
ncbi:MAG TPA: helix-turn-helix domain-containing protein [Solirubrobacteraceae bacterium]|jgi:AcrR family transcriptional regulator|nr:helix-turn-helix domain-containing protein [Solirubrobacteraceae bacterium]